MKIILDPVGGGASEIRGNRILSLLEKLKVSIIRRNTFEIAF